MNVFDISDSSLARCVLAGLLDREFAVRVSADDREQIEEAVACIHIFEDWQEFYEKTGWERDNPEEASAAYLTENRICRIICHKIWYFSRLDWDLARKKHRTGLRRNCDGIAT